MLRALSLVALVACATPDDLPPPGAPWREGPTMPGRRLEAAVAAVGTRLAVVGGYDTSLAEGLQITREVLVYDTLAETWSNLPDAPVAWTHAGLAGVGGALYLLGGLEGADQTPSGAAYVLTPGGLVWRELAPMPAGLERGAAAIVIAPPKIFVIGGATATAAVATVLAYDIARNEWSQLPDLPRARSHPAALRMVDGTLVVAGGLAGLGAGEPLADVYALRPTADAWELREPMPVRRGGAAYGPALGQLVLAGGEAGSDALASVVSYNPLTNEWSEASAMPAPRAGAQGAVIGQQLYVVGGASALVFEPLDTLLIYAPLNAIPRP